MKRVLFALFLVSCFEVDSHEFNPAHLIVDEKTETRPQTETKGDPPQKENVENVV